MVTFILLLVAVPVLLILAVGYFISAPRYKGPVSDHFDGRKFLNPGNVRAKGFGDVLRWAFSRKRAPWKKITQAPDVPKLEERIDQGVRITFINHSTFLIQISGLNILTDPVWSKRTSPFEWAGPERMRPPGLPLASLPKIDLLLLSHNHWDHLDIKTVKYIYEHHHPKVVTALGIKKFLDQHGIQSEELDWWDETSVLHTKIQSVPAQHFSGRGFFDRDATLWCGYIIKRPEGNIYFAGDTGYNDSTFKEIGVRCAPIDIAIVPIGAFKPIWFMAPIHCSPEEAVTIHKEIHTKVSIATHFGTFALADDGQQEPVIELKSALEKARVDPAEFLVLQEGFPRVF